MSTSVALTDNGVAARHSSESNEHYTPSAIVEAARETLGAIDLDPASCAAANVRVKATRYFSASASENGFVKPWSGHVFLNPPGGKMTPQGRSLRKLEGKGSGYAFLDTGEPCDSPAVSSAKSWWFKLASEFAAGRVTSAIFVGFSLEILQSTQVDTPRGLKLPVDCGLCFPSRRIAYMKADGSVGSSPPHASVLVHLGGDDEERLRFKVAFSKIGAVR